MPVNIKIVINDAALTRKLKKAGAEVAKTVALTSARQIASMGTLAFRDPSLRPREWAPLKEETVSASKKKWASKKGNRKKTFKKNPLIDTGALMHSLYVDQSATSASGDGKEFHAAVASDREYAAHHQFGGTSKHGKPQPPARPFLPFDELSPDGGSVKLTHQAERAVLRVAKSSVERILKDGL